MSYDPSGNLARGLLLKEQRRYAEAEEYIKGALSTEPNNALAFHALAACQFHQEKLNQAIDSISQAIALEPNESDHRALKSFILVGAEKENEARNEAREAVSLDPNSAYAHCAVAQASMAMEKWPETEEAARMALSIDPENVFAGNALAHALRLQNKMAQNRAHVDDMLARDPEDAYTHATAGWAALQSSDTRRAEDHFREALRLDPNMDGAREGLLHSFKARSVFYRAYLKYCFWMQRLSEKTRWAVIIGLMLFVRFVRPLFTGAAAPIGIAIGALYFLFVLWVHVAQGVGNFILLTDRFARYALKFRERVEAVFVGAPVVLGIISLAAGFALSSHIWTILGSAMIGAAFPFAYTFTNESRAGALLFGGAGLLAILAGGLEIFATLRPDAIDPGLVNSVTTFAIVGVVGTTWLCNVRALNQPM
ncbi:MAG: tetratricopeptide repeat protein [Spirochaetia bacterium]|nr:tetratricopeptide repeat protein [Spirochaetia bacterium]